MGQTVALKSWYPYQITPPVSDGYLLLSVCTVNPRRGASGFCGLKLWTWISYHHQRVAVIGYICSQVVVIVVMDLVQSTAMSAVLRSQVLEVQSILMDHILSRRRFAVSAGVGVISIPIWNPMAFQSIVLEIQCPALPAPIVARFSPQGRAGNPNCHVSLFLIFYGMGNSVFELDDPFSISQVEPGLGHKNLPFEMEFFTLRLCSRFSSIPQSHSRDNDAWLVSFNTDLFYVLF